MSIGSSRATSPFHALIRHCIVNLLEAPCSCSDCTSSGGLRLTSYCAGACHHLGVESSPVPPQRVEDAAEPPY